MIQYFYSKVNLFQKEDTEKIYRIIGVFYICVMRFFLFIGVACYLTQYVLIQSVFGHIIIYLFSVMLFILLNFVQSVSRSGVRKFKYG